MNTLMKFENTSITINTDNNEPLFEVYNTGMALGYSTISKGVTYPHKSRIDKILKNADIKPVVHGVQLFLTENQLYDFMLEARTGKCRHFRKWITDEVIPSIRKTGKYEIPAESEQLTLESEGYTRIQGALKSCGYNYQERTYDGIPVVTTSDIAYFIGITADSSRALLKEKGVYGKDYFKISGADMIKFKHQNKNCPQWSTLTLVTKSGFMLIAEHFERTKNPPPCFITDNKPVVAEKPKQRPAAHEFPRPTVDELIVALNVIQYARHNSEECEKIANMNIMADHYAKEQASLDTARKYIGMMLTL